jgi:hypothetical protein
MLPSDWREVIIEPGSWLEHRCGECCKAGGAEPGRFNQAGVPVDQQGVPL